ncbi:MAG: hypothetical protein ACLSHU_14020 [Oscillospiraceae bacterium]
MEDLLGLSGCGPTALSMVVIGMTGDISWNPAAVAQYAAEAGYVTENDGTAWALMSEGCSHFGLLAQGCGPVGGYHDPGSGGQPSDLRPGSR